MKKEKDRGPGVKLPPPLIFLFFIGLGYWLGAEFALPAFNPIWAVFLGGALCLTSVLIAACAAYQFYKAKTHIEPWQPATALLQSGVFQYSRNPIYLAFVLFTLGLGIFIGQILICLSTIPAVVTLHYLVIIREERYLAKRFGGDYLSYKRKVRRWI